MPTAAEFENALNGTPDNCFTFDFTFNRAFVRLDNWELRLNVNSSDPTRLHFTYFHHEKTSIYVHLQRGELDAVVGNKLKRLLTIAVQRAKADHPNRPAVVDLRRDDTAWFTVDA